MPDRWQPAPEHPEADLRDRCDSLSRDDEVTRETAAIPHEGLIGLETEIADYDASSRNGQVAADQRIFLVLAGENFAGVRTQQYLKILMRDAYPVILGWITTGQIFRECKRLNSPVSLSTADDGYRSEADRIALATDTVVKGRDLFEKRAFGRREWDWRRGASMLTFFVGASVLSFGAAYNGWWRERVVLKEVERQYLDDQEIEVRPGALVEPRRYQDPLDLIVLRDEVNQAMAQLPSQELRRIAALQGMGYARSEAAAVVGITEKAAERGFANHRAKLKAAQQSATPPAPLQTAGEEEK